MIAESVRRSALADYVDRFAAISAATGGDLSIRELPYLSQVNFRAEPIEPDLMRRLASSLGELALPVAPNTVTSRGDRRALWLGPDEWLIVGPDGKQAAFREALEAGLARAFGSIVDVSAKRAVLEIRGAKAPELLAHGIAIDLDLRRFGPGRCGQTLLARVQVIIERPDDSVFRLYVRTSFASYVADWLLDAAADPDLS